jgi:hypothetical protein
MTFAIMRKILAGLAIFAALAGFTHAFAQAPGPVPALPDSERRTSAVLSGSAGPVNVAFAVYGDGTDYGNWIEVFCNNVRMIPVTQWTMTSPSGAIGNLARPITDAQITFVAPQTCTVQIVGARRPRRVSQFAENRGVAARDLNQVLTDIIAQNRENWDKINDVTGRNIMGLPGEIIPPLPAAALRAGQVIGFDGTGLNPVMYAPGGGGGGGGSAPGLPVGSVQINGGGSNFAGSANLTYFGTTLTVGAAGSTTGLLGLTTAGGATATLGATGNGALLLPAANDTLDAINTAATFTNHTFDTGGAGNVFRIGGNPITSISGNTSKVLTVIGALTNAHCLTIDANGNAADSGASCGSGGGGATPGNPSTSVQFNSAGAFAGSSNLTFVSPVLTVGSTGVSGRYSIVGSTSGNTTLQAAAIASGNLTLPALTDTLSSKTSTDIFTNKTYDTAGTGNSFLINGVAVTANSGTGPVARATSPVFVTPTLGAALATSINGNVFTVGTKTLTFNNSITFAAGADGVTWTGPAVNSTLASLNVADQTVTGGANVTTQVQSSGNIVVDCGSRPLQSIKNTGAFNLTAPAADGSCMFQVINGIGAGSPTLINFSGKTPKGDSFSTGATTSSTPAANIFTIASPTTVTWTAHGLVTSAMVYFTSAGALPTGIVSGTIYYVCSANNTVNAFQLSSTRALAVAGTCDVNATGSQSGNETAFQPSVFLLTIAGVNGLATGIWTQQQ